MPNAVQPAVGGLRFEVLAEIALGSTARVDLCRTTSPVAGQLVAVKRLVAETAADPAVSSRFLDEVWMTSALRHPNVVGVVGWGNDEAGAYLAVELVQGVSVARLMKTVFDTREEFPERLVVYIGLCVLRGLQAAHELVSDRGEPLGLVHRDLGVQNVLVGFNGDVKIADFGLAKAKNRLTQTTSSLPTRAVGHLSPEELRGEEIDHRADLYGVGVMLYELLTGKPPFSGKDELETARLILSAPTPDPIRVRPRIDMSLAATVRRCLEKNPDARYRSARDVARDLDGWLYAHGYRDDNPEALGRFVRRNAMRQMRWFERVISGQKEPSPQSTATPVDASRARAPAPSATDASTVNRDAETTVVDANKKPRLPPRRSRSSDAVPAPKRRRDFVAEPTRREGFDANRNLAANLDEDSEDEGEDIPTVAMKRGDHPAFKALMEARASGASAGAASLETTGEATDPRATMPLHEPVIQDAASSDVIEIPDDPSTVTPPPRRAPPPRATAPVIHAGPAQGGPSTMGTTSNPTSSATVGSAGVGAAGVGSASAGVGSAGVGSAGLGSAGVGSAGLGSAGAQARPGVSPPRPVAPSAPPRPPTPSPSRALPPVHGFTREQAPPPRPAARALESPTTYDPGRTRGALAESTQPLSTDALAPDYIQHQIEQLRDDAALKSAEARRLRDIAEQARREADQAEAAAKRAERAASVAVEAIQAASSQGIAAATAKIEEALSIAEGR